MKMKRGAGSVEWEHDGATGIVSQEDGFLGFGCFQRPIQPRHDHPVQNDGSEQTGVGTHGLPVWVAIKVRDVQALENVQRYFTKLLLDYWSRLQKLQLLSLQRRRERFMIIHVWKIHHKRAPNDIAIVFYENLRLGVKIPLFNNRAQKQFTNQYVFHKVKVKEKIIQTINSIYEH